MHYQSPRTHGCRIGQFLQNQMEHLVLENAHLRLCFCLDKGADLLELRHKASDTNLLWHATPALTTPNVTGTQAADGNFFDYYRGGWQEILPGGGPYSHAGATMGIHGEAALLPWRWELLCDTAEEIAVALTCALVRFPLTIRKEIRLFADQKKIDFRETLHNAAAEPLPVMWGQHPAYGAPFVEAGTRIWMQAEELLACGQDYSQASVFPTDSLHGWPLAQTLAGEQKDLSRLMSEDLERTELFHVTRLREPWYAITNPRLGLGLGLTWDAAVFPHVWVWHGFAGAQGYPFWGNAHALAVEFWNGYPNSFEKAAQNGSLKWLQAGQTIEATFRFVLFEGIETVEGIADDGTVTGR